MNNSTLRKILLLAFFAVGVTFAFTPSRGESPFGVNAVLERQGDVDIVRVSFSIPAGYFLYADHVDLVPSPGVTLEPLAVSSPVRYFDKFSEEEKSVYKADFESKYRISGAFETLTLTVNYQGCSDQFCFFPESKVFTFTNQTAKQQRPVLDPVVEQKSEPMDLAEHLNGFTIRAEASGYLRSSEFIAFLDRAEGLEEGAAGDKGLFRFGIVTGIVLVFIGGMGLNLTPCVLPLIPVNLAIIGAGARSGSKKHGFIRGGIYGLGMALAYGVLGLFVVMTGAKFGALNSSPWFNLAIAIVFLALALAMFDWVTIDFSRFQRRRDSDPGEKNSYLLPFTMGIVAALLAGACVAPVVISVLLLAAGLYAQGQSIGLALPFLLGFGMGMPWAFAGAGLSFLPKPGPWMVRVKHGFGILILLLAVYYGNLSWNLLRSRPSLRLADPTMPEAGYSALKENQKLLDALDRARMEGRPVFIDFWATWCKNCHAMEKTTFNDARVKDRLASYIVVRYQVERPDQSPARELLDYFQFIGLPSYVVLSPGAS